MTTKPDNTVLLAGFEPFAEFTVNLSDLIVRELDGETIAGCRVEGIVLPVEFGESGDILLKHVEDMNPEVVFLLGLAAKRKEITIERLAVNLDDAGIPDNAGNMPVDQPIIPDGPPAYWSTLPVKHMAAAITENGTPASLSMTAGNFVCNHVFYRLMHLLRDMPQIRGGFMHMPLLDSQADEGDGLDLGSQLDAVRKAIESLLIHSLT